MITTKASEPAVELVVFALVLVFTVLGQSASYPFDLSNELQFSPSTNNPSFKQNYFKQSGHTSSVSFSLMHSNGKTDFVADVD